MIRYFLPKKVPKFAMFGPGLETSTSKLVRQIMYTDTVFHTEGLFPGQFDGKYLSHNYFLFLNVNINFMKSYNNKSSLWDCQKHKKQI